ncbi:MULTISPECIES: MATE family efflux transporter [Bacillus cereus group]|uniref:polysaccharide biosynthesis C-terminal domain-containing protein n=1 Tax=Bacillus cereus group TaxID=86661 RepID=UPI0009427497|nr:polysaccharide biosynthesis C-terminal domain-containing protein [Bacillus pacificus]MCU5372187.1 polysaccharide biosynthesis C-terminal domain-containing protein [Bacillus pacificus]
MGLNKGLANITFGLIRQLVMLVLGLILPRLIIEGYGSEVNGFMSSVTQFVMYLSLLEVGIGTASLQALYKPVSSGDKAGINAIMAATDRYYKRTGLIYGLCVIALAFLYPIFVDSVIPSATIIIFILISGMTGVINYLFQGKYKLLLMAEGKDYIITNLGTLTFIGTNVLKIVLISVGVNIILLQTVTLIFNILQMIYIYMYIKHKYGWLNLKVIPNYGAISQSKDVMIHEISYMVYAYTDVIFLSMIDLKMVSVYIVYNMVFGAVENILNTFTSGIQYLLGQAYYKALDVYKRLYDAVELLFLEISFAFYAVLMLFIEPFLKVYTSNVSDTEYLLKFLPVFFLVIKLLTVIRTITVQVVTVTGHFSNTKWISIIEAALNLLCTLIFIKYFSIYGVLIGTIVALTVRIMYMIYYTNVEILQRKPIIIIKRLVINSFVLIVLLCIFTDLTSEINSFMTMILYAIPLLILSIVIFFAVGLITDYKTSKYIVTTVIRKLPFLNTLIKK